MKKIISCAIIAVVFAATGFSIDLSVGGNVDFTHAFDITKMSQNKDYQKTITSYNLIGVKAFFDVQYVLVNLGADFKVGTEGYKSSYSVLGNTGSESNKTNDLSLTYFTLGILGKYPFNLGIAKIYPMLGFDFHFNVAAKAGNINLREVLTSEQKNDLNRYYFSFGLGSDVYVMDKLFIRPTALFGIKMNKSSEYKEYKKDAPDGVKYSENGFKFNVGLGVGYKL